MPEKCTLIPHHCTISTNVNGTDESETFLFDLCSYDLDLQSSSTIVKLASKVAGMPPAPERHEQVLQVWAESPTFEQEVTPPASRNARGRRQGRQPLNIVG